MPSSNPDANTSHGGLKKVRVGFHATGYTLRTLGNLLTLNQGGKLIERISDFAQGYKRISSSDKRSSADGSADLFCSFMPCGRKLRFRTRASTSASSASSTSTV